MDVGNITVVDIGFGDWSGILTERYESKSVALQINCVLSSDVLRLTDFEVKSLPLRQLNWEANWRKDANASLGNFQYSSSVGTASISVESSVDSSEVMSTESISNKSSIRSPSKGLG